MFSRISSLLSIIRRDPIDYSSQTARDIAYNTISRDHPAYISLLYPFIAVLIVLYPDLRKDSSSTLTYIFNCIVLLCLFLPATFYLYKQLIREISVLVVENIFFSIVGDPRVAVWRNWSPVKLNDKCKERLVAIAHDRYNITIDKTNTKRTTTSFADSIKDLVSKIRKEENVRTDSINFENNCVYGFFRNLIGGLVLNLILYYLLSWFHVFDSVESLETFFTISIPILWILTGILLLPTWHARLRYAERLFTDASWLNK